MDLAVAALQAVGLFFVTNIDDIIVLSLFFARGAGAPGTTAKITAGQYIGFGAILVASVLVALGANAFLPEGAIPYFGLIPLLLGLYAAWQAWRNRDDDDDDDPGKAVAVWTVAAVTFANGGDNIGVPRALGARPVPPGPDRPGHRHPRRGRRLRALALSVGSRSLGTTTHLRNRP